MSLSLKGFQFKAGAAAAVGRKCAWRVPAWLACTAWPFPPWTTARYNPVAAKRAHWSLDGCALYVSANHRQSAELLSDLAAAERQSTSQSRHWHLPGQRGNYVKIYLSQMLTKISTHTVKLHRPLFWLKKQTKKKKTIRVHEQKINTKLQ